MSIWLRVPEDPSESQTEAEIAEYYKGAKTGDIAVFVDRSWNDVSFVFARITNVKSGRIYLDRAYDYGGVAFYCKSGRNCRAPKGQAHLVVPTLQVIWSAKKNNTRWVGGESIPCELLSDVDLVAARLRPATNKEKH
jgi:hypothetical protein